MGNTSLKCKDFTASQVAQPVKNPPAIQETPVQLLGREAPLERGWATHSCSWASLVAQLVEPACSEAWVQSLGWEDLLEEGMTTHLQYSCLDNPHGQRNLVGYSPWGHKGLDKTEHKSNFPGSACL